MPTDYLPELKDHKLEEARAGKWSGFDSKTEIVKLAEGLNVAQISESEKKAGPSEIYSIPDPWARAMLFARALFDEHHPAHGKILGEWRGLLAILALKEIRNFNELKFQQVGLSEGALRASNRAPGSFIATLAKIRPGNHDLILDATSWDSFHVLKWSGQNGGYAKAFAMNSPTTLVATGAYYAETISVEEVPWFKPSVYSSPSNKMTNGNSTNQIPTPSSVDPAKAQKVLARGGVLGAPTADHLSRIERVGLAQWLNFLRTKLSIEVKGARATKLLGLLDNFRDEMLAGLDIVELETDEDKIFSDAPIGFAPNGKGLFALIDRPAKVETKVFTDVMLVTPGSEQRYLLLDQGILLREEVDGEQTTREAKDIAFYNDINLATAPRHYPVGEATKILNGKLGLSYCTKEFFFEPDLIYILKSSEDLDLIPGCLKVEVDAKKSHHCWQFRQALFPITEEAAKLFPPEEWARRCKLTWTSPSEAVFRIRLEVKSVANANAGAGLGADISEPTAITLEKTYNEGFLHPMVHQPPLIGVWPNAQFPDEPAPSGQHGAAQEPANRWKRYFLFESWRGGATEAKGLELRARPLREAGVKRLIKQGSEYFQITRLSRFPQVLVCETPSEIEMQNKPNVVQGLLLLNPPERPSTASKRDAVLGVDFGTTATSIYRAFLTADGKKTESPEPVRFEDKRFAAVTASGEQMLRSVTRELFIPARGWQAAKILSIYQDLESKDAMGDEAARSRLAILHGHVLFSDEKDPNAYVPEKQRGSVRSDLKWGKKEAVTKAARDFITQLCTQAALELVCEGAESITIRYSYPTAFDESDVSAFLSTWETVIAEVAKATSVKVTAREEDVDKNYEAIAAARYFKEEAGWTAGGGALTLDIGGGTTDIALWNTVDGKPTLLSHSSVLFAGRNMFLAAIHEYPQVLEKIRNPHRDPAPLPEFKETKEELGEAFAPHIDAYIQMHGDKLMEDKGIRFSEDNLQLTAFLRIIELGLCGIAFYSGLQWGRMLCGNGAAKAEGEETPPSGEAPLQEVRALETASSIRVYVGGNGSKLLHWCGKGRFKRRSEGYASFARSLQAGVEQAAPGLRAKEVDIVLSEKPKEEVAFGLVLSGRETEKSRDFTMPLAGESFILDGSVQKVWSDPLDLKSLRARTIEVGDKQKMAGASGSIAGRLPVFGAFLESVDERLDERVLEAIALSVNDRLGEISDEMREAARKSTEKELNRRNPVRAEPIFFLALKDLLDRKIKQLKAMSLKDAGEE